MLRIARSFALALLVLLVANSAFAQKGGFAAARDAQLDKYPLFEVERPLTVAQIADMHLHPLRLEKPTVVQNHFRKLHGKEGRFVVETLPTGTLVLADENGNLRYKADCGNRLVEFDNQALVRGIVSSIKLPETTPAPPRPTPAQVKAQSRESGLWKFVRGVWGHTLDVLRPLANWLGWWIGWGLVWLLLALIAYAIYESAQDWGQPRNQPTIRRPGDPGYVATAPPPAAQPIVPTDVPHGTPAGGTEASNKATRSFISHSAGGGSNPHLLRWGGVDFQSLEIGADGVHSLRYHHQPSSK